MVERIISGGFALSKSISHLLHRAQQAAADRFAEEIGGADLTLRQFAVLAAVAERAGQTQTDLVRATGIDRSTLADMIGRMESRGFITRVKSQEDARAKSVALTPAGRTLLNHSAPSALAADNAVLEAVPRNRRDALIKALAQLAQHMEADGRRGDVEEADAPAPRKRAAPKAADPPAVAPKRKRTQSAGVTARPEQAKPEKVKGEKKKKKSEKSGKKKKGKKR